MIDFEDLPFDFRPDLSPYLIHLTKNTKAKDEYTAFENLVSILETGKIWGSDSKEGFIKGNRKAACFMDIPLSSLKYIFDEENCDTAKPRYEPFGILVTKKFAYQKGCRPVLYLSNTELEQLCIPKDELWRVVRFEVNDDGKWISWLHEREWRCPDSFPLPTGPLAVLVKNTKLARELQKLINNKTKKFKIKPQSIIPLSVICQGLPYL